MRAYRKDAELARIILSQCVDQLAALLAKVRAQEPFLLPIEIPTLIRQSCSRILTLMAPFRSLRGIVAHLNDIKSA